MNEPDTGNADSQVDRLLAELTARWREFPADQRQSLRTLLQDALAQAGHSKPEVITIAGSVTRPGVLRLAVLARAQTDDYYTQEWVEFAVAAEGGAYVVYRRRDQNDYAAPWSLATTLPEGIMRALDPALMLALCGGDG